MKFSEVLDTRELASDANDAVEVGHRLMAGDKYLTDEEIKDANHTLASMRYALRDLGFDNVPYEEMADRWMQVGEENGTRLVRNDYIGEFFKRHLLETGVLSKEIVELLKGAVDWDAAARNQNFSYANFNHPSQIVPNYYWIF